MTTKTVLLLTALVLTCGQQVTAMNQQKQNEQAKPEALYTAIQPWDLKAIRILIKEKALIQMLNAMDGTPHWSLLSNAVKEEVQYRLSDELR